MLDRSFLNFPKMNRDTPGMVGDHSCDGDFIFIFIFITKFKHINVFGFSALLSTN